MLRIAKELPSLHIPHMLPTVPGLLHANGTEIFFTHAAGVADGKGVASNLEHWSVVTHVSFTGDGFPYTDRFDWFPHIDDGPARL